MKEGNLQAPKRLPLDWQNEDFYDRQSLDTELERVFDICHGCRRCVSLCASFPTLFDLVDESETLEVDGVDKADYSRVVDECFLCDLCAETKCPYLPPHEWAVDFPHLMLRAKAVGFKEKKPKWRDRLITSTDALFTTLSIPLVSGVANAAARSKVLRKVADKTVGIHKDAPVPTFHAKTLTKRVQNSHVAVGIGEPVAVGMGEPVAGTKTTGKVAIFITCYGNHNEPQLVEDLIAVLTHNQVEVKILGDAKCCGMPKLELGDLDRVAQQKEANISIFMEAVNSGYDIIAPIPSCVLMYKQELPLMFTGDSDLIKVKEAFFDPFEYLMLRHKDGLANTSFERPLGKVAYHAACHQRVQNFGAKTKAFLSLIPGTEVVSIERCSGHDGTYAVKSESYEKAMKIARPVVNRVRKAEPDTFGSDCPMAGRMIEHGLQDLGEAQHPVTMLKKAYGL